MQPSLTMNHIGRPRLVIKRSGFQEEFSHSKLTNRIYKAMDTVEDDTRRRVFSEKLKDLVISKISLWPLNSCQIDLLIRDTAASNSLVNPPFERVACGIELQYIYAATPSTFSSFVARCDEYLSDEFKGLVKRNKPALDRMVDADRDRLLSYDALRVISKYQLVKIDDVLVERPQYMMLRTALQIHGDDVKSVRETYEIISTLRMMPVVSLLSNAGLKTRQLIGTFMMAMDEDPDHIVDALSKVARIRSAGGSTGIGLQCVPATGSMVKNRSRPGLPAVLRMFDSALGVVDPSFHQRAPGTVTVYVEVWHADVIECLNMKRSNHPEFHRTEKLHLAIMINDLFMHRVVTDGEWTLFCPSVAPELIAATGEMFDSEYQELERAALGHRTVKARALWRRIIETQIETGGPFLIFKDAVNDKSNQRNMGTITHGNISGDTFLYADEESTGCPVATIVLPTFVDPVSRTFSFPSLTAVIRLTVLSLTRIVLQCRPPVPTARVSLWKNRCISIGVQGLADALILMGIPYDSQLSYQLNAEISEAIYHAAVDASCDLIGRFGAYPNFGDSMAARGILQFDHWENPIFSGRFDWSALRKKLVRGMANSLLVSYAPTHASSHITGWSEGVEPHISLLKNRLTPGRTELFAPQLLVKQLSELDLWNADMVGIIASNRGSIQSIQAIPEEVRALFKTGWDVSPDALIRLSAARGPFVCNSQSMYLYFKDPAVAEVSDTFMYAWKLGLKTAVTYMYSRTSDPARREHGNDTHPDVKIESGEPSVSPP